jgi:hypothetical protein
LRPATVKQTTPEQSQPSRSPLSSSVQNAATSEKLRIELDDRDQTYAAAWTTLGAEVDSIAVLAATLTVEELADEVLRTHDAQSLSVPS